MSWIKDTWKKAIKDSVKDRKVRVFALLILAILGLNLYFRWETFQHHLVLLAAIAAYPLCSLILPQILRPLLVLWLFIGGVLGEIASFVLLTIIYFFLAWPLKVFMRKKPTSGWKTPEETESDYSKLY